MCRAMCVLANSSSEHIHLANSQKSSNILEFLCLLHVSLPHALSQSLPLICLSHVSSLSTCYSAAPSRLRRNSWRGEKVIQKRPIYFGLFSRVWGTFCFYSYRRMVIAKRAYFQCVFAKLLGKIMKNAKSEHWLECPNPSFEDNLFLHFRSTLIFI